MRLFSPSAQLASPMPETPSINQLAESQPLENSQRLVRRHPPLTGSVLEVPGVRELEHRTSGPSAYTSSSACRGQ